MISSYRILLRAMALTVALYPMPSLCQETVDDLFGMPADEEPVAPAATPPSNPAAEVAVPSQAEPSTRDALFDDVEQTQATPTDPQPSPATTAAAPGPMLFEGFSGFWQNELAYTYVGDEHFSKWKNIGRVVAKGRFSDKVRWQVSGHLIYDPNFELTDFYPDRVEDNQKLDGWFHETFVSLSKGSWEWTLGRQNIVWGEAVGLFFADVVSALDLREFVLPDFELIRIPQWAVRSEYYGENLHAELIYVPIVTTDEIGEPGADYFPFAVSAPPGVEVRFLDEQEPGKFGRDFAAGGRLSYLLNGWDGALFYYTSPDRSASFQRQFQLSPRPTLTFRGVHERIHQFGGTLSKDAGLAIVKLESVYTVDRLASVTDPLDLDGLAQTDELRYLIAADWGIGEHNFNAQLFQTWFLDHESGMVADEVESGISLMFKTAAIHPDIEPELIWIRSLNRNEWLLETRVSWRFDEDWRWTLGSDIVEGPQRRFFGRFDQTDRVYTELRYSF